MADLETEFTQAMFDIYRRAKSEAGYTATIFLKMLTDTDGRRTAKTLIDAARPSDGYGALFERGHLDLTVEALITQDARWRSLFEDEEIERAGKRLRAYGYEPSQR